eukprot:gene10409-2938_t
MSFDYIKNNLKEKSFQLNGRVLFFNHKIGNCPQDTLNFLFSELKKNKSWKDLDLRSKMKFIFDKTILVMEMDYINYCSLFDSLKVNTSIKVLDLSIHKRMKNSNGVKNLFEMLKENYTIKEILLRGNRIDCNQCEFISDYLINNETLKVLNLSSNEIGSIGCKIIFDSLKKNHTLEYLDLRFNSIDCNACESISMGLMENKNLKELDLCGNQIETRGVKLLTEGLEYHKNMEMMDLYDQEEELDFEICENVNFLLECNLQYKMIKSHFILMFSPKEININFLKKNSKFFKYFPKFYITVSEQRHFQRIINGVGNNSNFHKTASELGISREMLQNSIQPFSKEFFVKFDDKKFYNSFQNAIDNDIEIDLIEKLFLKFIIHNYESGTMNLESISNLLNLNRPEEEFPEARKLKRKIVFHTGPTNSGKSFSSIERLLKSKTGVYCSPLRLLATEVYTKLNSKGVNCSLMTGDDKREIENSNHISCTVEMFNVNKRYDCVVIDEIQMINDPNRGHAWTKAFLGAISEEIHLCGEERTIKIIQKLCQVTGDELEIKKYERLTPLEISKKSIHSWKDLKKGDCVITFTRREIFRIKNEIEQQTKFKVAIVYGSLPPETRVKQAELFNSTNNDYDVLVATDAIGYGLNLNIKRIIFYKVTKFDGMQIRNLNSSEVKQIGGRAGRFQSRYPLGEITAFKKEDLNYIEQQYYKPNKSIRYAGIAPSFKKLEEAFFELEHLQFSQILEKFLEISNTEKKYFICDMEDQIEIAALIDDIEMPFSDRLKFTMVPIDTDNMKSMSALKRFAHYHSKGEIVRIQKKNLNLNPKTSSELSELESYYQLLTAYCWLSYQFEDTFIQRELAKTLQLQCSHIIEKVLKKGLRKDEKPKRSKRERRRNYRDSIDYELSQLGF